MSLARVVVALGAERGEPLASAVRLAHALPASLLGVFVEDDAWRRLAALPFAQVAGHGPLSRALDPVSLERALRRAAAELEAALAGAAASLPLGWSFRVARGPTAAEASALAEPDDLLVIEARALGAAGATVFGRARASVLCLRGRPRGPVVVRAELPAAALAVAAQLAAAAGGELLLLATEPSAAARRAAAAAGVALRHAPHDGERLAMLASRAVVVAAPDEAERLLRTLRCSLLVVR